MPRLFSSGVGSLSTLFPKRSIGLLAAASLLILTTSLHASLEGYSPAAFVEAGKKQLGVTISYDPTYRSLSYPGGDVPIDTGVCTDVIIRALRQFSFDLQKEVHQEMKAHFSKYPKRWGLKAPDKNIDHRRVPNLEVFFERRGWRIPLKRTNDGVDYSVFKAGDIVTCLIGERLPHIVIISDQRDATGEPLVIHNIGGGTQEELALSRLKITGHYRIRTP